MLSKVHPFTLMSMNNLAEELGSHNKYDERIEERDFCEKADVCALRLQWLWRPIDMFFM